MLNRETFRGPWAGLPVAWTDGDELDETAYRHDVASCCRAGVPGVYTGGTSGEVYTQELDEFRRIAQITVEECAHRGVPAMIGCTATSTRGAVLRAQVAHELDAAAIQVALPFWMEVADDQVLPFFSAVSAAAENCALSIYETTRAKKTLTVEQHRAIAAAIPQYQMVKANAGTIGAEVDGCRALSEFVNVFVGESLWADLGPVGAAGCCSSVVYWNPQFTLALFRDVEARNWPAVDEGCAKLKPLFDFLHSHYTPKGFTDTAFDRMGGLATRFLATSQANRAPYVSPTKEDVATLRAWLEEYFTEFLEL